MFNTAVKFIIGFGFVIIALSIIFKVGAIANSDTSVSWGVSGLIETRCEAGFKFIVTQDGRATQVLDSFGKGVPCK